MSDGGGTESMEALFRGQKGDSGAQGETGKTGAPGMTAAAKRAFIFLTLLTLLLAGGGLVIGVREISALRAQVRADCKFDADLGGAPVALNPATNKPSLLAVTIVSDTRVAWHQHGCTGRIPPADPSFIRWAKFYRLPYR